MLSAISFLKNCLIIKSKKKIWCILNLDLIVDDYKFSHLFLTHKFVVKLKLQNLTFFTCFILHIDSRRDKIYNIFVSCSHCNFSNTSLMFDLIFNFFVIFFLKSLNDRTQITINDVRNKHLISILFDESRVLDIEFHLPITSHFRVARSKRKHFCWKS